MGKGNFQSITAIALACIALVAGCEVGPTYHEPTADVAGKFDTGPELLPTTFPTTPTAQAGATTQPTAARKTVVALQKSEPIDLTHWWSAFDDAELNSLILRAAAANFDVGMAVARLQEERANYSAVTGEAWPTIDITATGARGSGTNSTKGRIGQPLNAGTNTTGYHEITEVAGFDAGWELDLFGRVRREGEAAKADVQAAMEDRNLVLVSMLAEVSRDYIRLRSEQIRLRIAQENIAALRRTVRFTRDALRQGLGNQFNVVLAERELSAGLANVAPLSAAVGQSQRQIAVLLGDDPQALYQELSLPATIPAMTSNIEVGVPTQLLRRRPDIRESERELAAETARVGVANADLFPRVVLTAGLGFQGQGLGRAPVQNNLIWSVGPAVSLPLLDFGRLDALVQVEDYRTQRFLLSYRKTVVIAVQEVEDALANYSAQQDRLDQLHVAVDSSRQAVNLATQRYNRGLTDFLNVLDAQRQFYDLEDQLAVTQQDESIDLIALFKSLGGGWETFTRLPAPPHIRPAIIAAIAPAKTDSK
jgi:NodT family efflux transporter outer membrane factor (OMF) lipoprotein